MTRFSRKGLIGLLVIPAVVFAFPGSAWAKQRLQGDLRKMGVYYVTLTNFATGTTVEGAAPGSGACYELALPKVNDLAGLATAINTFLTNEAPTESPFQGMGPDFVEGSVRQGINPLFVVGNLRMESVYGTAGNGLDQDELAYKLQAHFNGFGRTASESQPHFTHNGRNWYAYPSWKESINSTDTTRGQTPDQPALMKKVYLDDGLLTIGQYLARYAPASDGNDESVYGKIMKDTISKIIALAGSSLGCTDSETVVLPGDEGRPGPQ